MFRRKLRIMAVTVFWMVCLTMNRRALHHRLFYANFNQPRSETQGGKLCEDKL